MKLSTVSSLIALGAVLVASGYQIGCSGSPSTSSGAPPPPPNNPTQASSNVETFAVKTLYLGEAPRSGGAPTANAWKAFGYNLDGKNTTATSTDVCTLVQGATKSVQVDGNNGIDNSFGENILPILQTFLSTPSTTVSTDIDEGKFTIMVQVTGLDDTPTQNSINLAGQIFAGGAYPGTPTFDLTTDWPVTPDILKDGQTIGGGSKVQMPNGYINNGTYVSGDLSKGGITVSLSLVIQGQALTLAINSAVISFNHGASTVNPDGTFTVGNDKTSASNGIIAGVIDTNDLLNGLQAVAGRLSASLCNPATFAGIANQIKQQSDILHDGTNVAGQTCDGISIGIGFEAKLVKNPDIVAFTDAGIPGDPCEAGTGTDSGNDTGSNDATGQ